MNRRPRVVIDARLRPGSAGGVQTVIEGLLNGLRSVDADDLDLHVLGWADASEWLEPITEGVAHATFVRAPDQGAYRRFRRAVGRGLGPARESVRRIVDARGGDAPSGVDASIAGLRPDLVHYVFQSDARTDSPYIYQPHDLQHVHLPHNFTRGERQRREAVYGRACRGAASVVVASSWVAADVAQHFDIDPSRIQVIPLAPLSRPLPAVLPERPPYAIYPAAPWPHKNHVHLLEAMRRLVDRGLDVRLVLTGASSGDHHAVTRAIARLGLRDRVEVLGYVSDSELAGAMAGARCLVMPSRFEAGSFPVWEAMSLGVPVAASSITSLPRQVGDAGLLFDPESVESIADAWGRLWADAGLRADLAAKGRESVGRFTWARTSRLYVALYRRILGVQSREDDELLLQRSLL